MSIIQSCWTPVGLSSAEIDGRPRTRTVPSMVISSSGRTRTARPNQVREVARAGAWADGAVMMRLLVSCVVDEPSTYRPKGRLARPCGRSHRPTDRQGKGYGVVRGAFVRRRAQGRARARQGAQVSGPADGSTVAR